MIKMCKRRLNPIICLFLVTTAVLLWLYCKYLPNAEKDIAAWIQAGGSILAIIASLGIADWSRKSKQSEQQKNVFAVVQAAHAFAKKISKVTDDSKASELMVNHDIHSLYHRNITDGFARALANIPFHEVGTSEAVAAIIDMQVQFERFMPNSLDLFIAGPQNHPSYLDAEASLDLPNHPERYQKSQMLYESSFTTLAENLRGNLKRIDYDFQLINDALG